MLSDIIFIFCVLWSGLSFFLFYEYEYNIPFPVLGKWNSANPYWVNIFGGMTSLFLYISFNTFFIPPLILIYIIYMGRNIKTLAKIYRGEDIDALGKDTLVYSKFIKDKSSFESTINKAGCLSLTDEYK